MKRFVKCVCLLLAAAMMMTIPANAAEDMSARSSSFFMKCNVYLYEVSDTIFQACFHVTGMKIMDKIGASEIKIQRSSDNETWSTMKTYSMADYSSMIAEDSITHTSYVTYVGTKGYYYRAYIKLYAEDSTGTGIWNQYTSSIYLD